MASRDDSSGAAGAAALALLVLGLAFWFWFKKQADELGVTPGSLGQTIAFSFLALAVGIGGYMTKLTGKQSLAAGFMFALSAAMSFYNGMVEKAATTNFSTGEVEIPFYATAWFDWIVWLVIAFALYHLTKDDY